METLAMSKAERRRLEVMSQVKCGKMVLGIPARRGWV